MEIRPIKTEKDYQAALKLADEIFDAPEGTPEADQLDVIVTLIEAYEREHFPMEEPDPIEAIKFRMEQEGLTRNDLAEAIGSRARVSEVLNRKRALTLPMIRELASRFQIPAEALIQPYELA
jgi:HTH-type transcriptional regulator/antitoxin HigA